MCMNEIYKWKRPEARIRENHALINLIIMTTYI